MRLPGEKGLLALSALFTFGICQAPNLLCSGAEPGKTGRDTKPPQLLIPAGVFDSENGKIDQGWVVLVPGTNITAVGPRSEVQAPADAITVPLSEMTLLPGLMDIHSHIFLHPYNEALW